MEDPNYKVALNLILQSMATAYNANMHVNHQIVLTLGPTPKLLVDYGFPPLPLAITGKVVDKCVYDHGLTKGTLERAYQMISTPKSIYQTADTGCVVMSYDTKGPDPLILAIHPSKQLGGRKEFYNNVASIYYKQNNPEVRWKQQGFLMWEAF